MAVNSPVARARMLAPITLLVACQYTDEPIPLYEGRWIDIAVFSNDPTDTCVGTFEYVDAYAGVLAAEFGIDGPLGTYTWYTPGEYDDLFPCGERRPYPWACAIDDTVHSAILPHEHEIVHIANFHTGPCPGPLSEGLAEYYSTVSTEGREDLDVLASHLADPQATIPLRDYEMLGRFAGFLVEEYGLRAVLDVCATTGRGASGEQLAQAMENYLGASPDELLAELSEQPSRCNDFRRYRSKVFACGKHPAAQKLDVGYDDFETTLEFGCDRAGSVFAPFSGGVQRFFSFDAPVDDIYLFWVWDEATGDIPTGVALEVSRCGPCEDLIRNSGDPTDEWQFPVVAALKAGRHSLEIRMPADFSGTLRLEIDR